MGMGEGGKRWIFHKLHGQENVFVSFLVIYLFIYLFSTISWQNTK